MWRSQGQCQIPGLSSMSSIHGLVHGCVVFNIAATPQGGSELFPARQGYEGNRIIRFAHSLIPSLCCRNPPRGFLQYHIGMLIGRVSLWGLIVGTPMTEAERVWEWLVGAGALWSCEHRKRLEMELKLISKAIARSAGSWCTLRRKTLLSAQENVARSAGTPLLTYCVSASPMASI